MPHSNNEVSREARLRVGLIADLEHLPALGRAIAQTPRLELASQAGMPQGDALPGAAWFDDTRVLIAQGGLDALIIGRPTRAAADLARMALERNLSVWRTPPLARAFAEAVETVRQARRHTVVYRVASRWDALDEPVRWALRDGAFRPLYSEVSVSAAGPSVQSWRSSAVDACGGVLAGEAYDVLEALLKFRKLPDTVLATVGRCRRRAGEPPRETEDVAGALLRFADGGLALVRTVWDLPPYERRSAHHGPDATITIDERVIRRFSADHALLDEQALPDENLAAELARFATAIRGGGYEGPAADALDRHLAVSALLEAIYLSARTGQPEQPRKLFDVQGWPEPEL